MGTFRERFHPEKKKPLDKWGKPTGITLSNRYELLAKDTRASPDTAQTVLDIGEREATDVQEIGAHSLIVEDEIAATLPTFGLQEAAVKSPEEICEIEAELSTTNTSSEYWAEEVAQSPECNKRSDHEADASKMVDKTFEYSSDLDTDEITLVSLKLQDSK
ncbi:hypothetical protein JTB14_000286 [Gonioctena quinquepunctata]|nr:hypothetical protein JTB14_000286 [Gonioctena quinquepunctata]